MRKRQLARVFVDAMASNLIRTCKNSRAIIIFGQSREVVDEIEHEVRETAGVVIRTHIELTEIGKRRVVQLAYGHNEWWNRAKLLERMTSERFDDSPSSCDLIFTHESDLSSLSARKVSLRKSLPSSHFERRIHGTDDHFETVFLAEFALNANSILFANTAPLGSEDRIFAILKGLVPQSDFATTESNWCIDGSSVLELFGLRQANDIDFYVCNGSRVPAILRKACTDHSKEYASGFVDPFEIIVDPRNHLIYKGLKFISPSALLSQKFRSADTKSKFDVAHLTSLQNRDVGTYASINAEVTGFISRFGYRLVAISDRMLRRFPHSIEMPIRTFVAKVRRYLK